MKTLKVRQEAGQVQTITLKGKKTDPEPLHLRVRFPGGEFEITRTSDDDYWLHVYANNEAAQGYDSGAVMGEIREGRLDTHDATVNLGPGGMDLLDEHVYHLAFRVGKRTRK